MHREFYSFILLRLLNYVNFLLRNLCFPYFYGQRRTHYHLPLTNKQKEGATKTPSIIFIILLIISKSHHTYYNPHTYMQLHHTHPSYFYQHQHQEEILPFSYHPYKQHLSAELSQNY